MSFAPDGLLATGGTDGSVRLWDMERGALVRVIRHPALQAPSELTWSADGATLLVTSAQAVTRGPRPTNIYFAGGARLAGEADAKPDGLLFDRSGHLVRALRMPLSGAQPVEDGRFVTFDFEIGTREENAAGKVSLLDPGACLQTQLTVPGGLPLDFMSRVMKREQAVSATPAGDRVAAIYPEHSKVVHWSTAQPQVPHAIDLGARPSGVALDPSSERILVTFQAERPGEMATLRLFGNDGVVRSTVTLPTATVGDMLVAPEGAVAYLTGEDAVYALSLADGRVQWMARNVSGARLALSHDGRQLIVALGSVLAVLNPNSGDVVRRVGEVSPLLPEELVFVPKERLLLSRVDGAYSVWSLTTGERLRRVPAAGLVGLGVSGGRVVAARLHAESGCEPHEIPIAVDALTPAGLPSLDGTRALVRPARVPGTAPAAWDVQPQLGKTLCASIKGCTGRFNSVEAADLARGQLVLGTYMDRFDHLTPYWALLDLQSGLCSEIDQAYGFGGPPQFEGGGRMLRARRFRGGDNWVELRSLDRGAELKFLEPRPKPQPLGIPTCDLRPESQTFPSAESGAEGIVVSDDGDRVAVWTRSVLSVREVSSGYAAMRLELEDEVTTAAFSGDDLLIGLEDGSLLRIVNGTVQARQRDMSGAILAIEPAADGSAVATVSEEGVIRIWDRDLAGERVALVEFDDDETLAFAPDGSYRATGEAATRIAWVYDDPTEAFRFEQFASTFDRPAAIEARLAGIDSPAASFTTRPPSTEIASAEVGANGRASVVVRASSSSSVARIRAFVEGVPAGDRTTCGARVETAFELPLFPGESRVTIAAFDGQGLASNLASVSLTTPAPTQRPDIHVVAVGIDEYPGLPAEMQLQYARADAAAIATLFQTQAGPGRTYAQAHVRTLTGSQAKPEAILAALRGLSTMKPTDVGVVFFSGHGIKPSEAEDMVFATSALRMKADGSNDEFVVDPSSFADGSIGWRAVSTALAGVKGRVLVLLDACHAGHLTQEVVAPNNRQVAALLDEGRAGVVVFAASKGRQLSFEPGASKGVFRARIGAPRTDEPPADPGGHGLFTDAILEAMNAPDPDGDGALRLSELVERVTLRVSAASQGQQTPWLARRETFGDFVVTRSTTKPSAATP